MQFLKRLKKKKGAYNITKSFGQKGSTYGSTQAGCFVMQGKFNNLDAWLVLNLIE